MDPKATDGTKVLEFPTEIIVQQQLVHVYDQPAIVPAELFVKPAGSKTTSLNRVSQINIVTDATVARAELVEKPTGFKSIVVHDESQELECVDVLDSVAAIGDKAMLEQAKNCPNSPSDQANAGLNLECELASEMQNKLPEGPVSVAGENTLFPNKAGTQADLQHIVANDEGQELCLLVENSSSNGDTTGQFDGSNNEKSKGDGTSKNGTRDGWTVVARSPARQSSSPTLKN
ncbi:hypothetical protein A4A49_07720 [Nicotiana attenuata]|uniref:Uncharacterized protein n=1 Tax=Nicotiana attenuata TaxID=49451 RepID=A0A314KVA3_NICAT|nr:hypothetical protein A4A49_07720 [Nicotiana attenuata]